MEPLPTGEKLNTTTSNSTQKKAWCELIRLPNLFTAISNSLAAHWLITGGEVDWLALFWLTLACTCLYHSGMIFNDCFDYQEDLKERPQRPLPSGKISIRSAWFAGAALMLAGVACASMVSMTSLVVAALLSLLILAYDGWIKNRLVSSVAMAGCRYMNWLLAMTMLPLTIDSFLLPLPIAIYVFSLTILSKEETSAENRTPLLITVSGVILCALILVTFLATKTLNSPEVLWLVLPAVAYFLYQMWQTYQAFTPEKIQSVIGLLVLGIIPLDAIMAMAGGHWFLGIFIAVLIVPAKWLAKHLYVT